MGTEQDDEPDLMLVSTYAPVVLAVLKTTLFLASMQLLEYLSLALNLQTVIVCVVLYLDYNKTRQDKFERASGFLFFVALSVHLKLTAPDACTAMFAVMSRVVALIWAVASSSWVVLSCSGIKTPVPLTGLVLATSALAGVHLLGDCSSFVLFETVLRVLIFLLMCSVMFFGKRYIPSLERNSYVRSISFVCSHVLSVDVYIMLPSFVICVFCFFMLAYRSGSSEHAAESRLESCEATAMPAAHAFKVDSDEQFILSNQVRAALAQSDTRCTVK